MLTSMLILLAAVPPRALPDAESVVWVPVLSRLATVTPFFERAGERAVVLRPASWRDSGLDPLRVDLTDLAALKTAGIDPTGAFTLSRNDRRSAACLKLADAAKFSAFAKPQLNKRGELSTRTVSGVSLTVAKDALGRVMAATATKGTDGCVAGAGAFTENELPELAALLTRAPPSTAGLKLAQSMKGAVLLIKPSGSSSGALSLTTTTDAATVDLQAKGSALGALLTSSTSVFGGAAPDGVLRLRASVDPRQLPQTIESVLGRVPGGRALIEPTRALAPSLSGHLFLLVRSVKVGGSLRSAEARFFALKLALAVEVKDPALARSLAEAVDPARLTFREGTLSIEVHDSLVVLSTDAAAKAALLASLPPKPTPIAHAVEGALEPAMLARALAQVPLFESLQVPELAALLGVSTEIGPLLMVSQPTTLWLDPASGGQKGQLVWKLRARDVDAGVP